MLARTLFTILFNLTENISNIFLHCTTLLYYTFVYDNIYL